MRKALLAVTLAAVAVPTAPALADPPPWAHAHGRRHHDRDYRDYRGYDRSGYGYQSYQSYQPYRMRRGDNYWRGDNGDYYCRRKDGTTGMIIGAAGGALIGRSLDRNGSRTPGTIIGAAVGALLGREIERGNAYCR